MVDPSNEPKTDKLSILGEAIRFVQQTQLENSQLRQLNKFLEVGWLLLLYMRSSFIAQARAHTLFSIPQLQLQLLCAKSTVIHRLKMTAASWCQTATQGRVEIVGCALMGVVCVALNRP
jgi:hypothetical protein